MRNYIVFVACLGAVFSLAPLAIDMYLPALPTMAGYLDASIDDVEASVSIFLLGFAVGQLVFGPLSDRFGRVPMLLSGLGLFVAGSVLCALATDVGLLYAFRFVQAIGGGASVVVFPMVKDRFDEKGVAQVLSYIMAVVVIAPLVAPIIGGYVLVMAGWQPIFYGLAVYGGLVLLAVRLLIEPWRKPADRKATTLSASVGRLMSGYRDVLANGPAMAHILVGAFAFAGLFAFVAGSPFVYITWFGVAPENYGLLVGLNAFAMLAANIVNARLLHNIQPTRKAVVGAFILGGVGVMLLAFNALGLGLAWIAAGVVAYVGMLGLVATNSIAGALAHFSEDSGTGSAVYGVVQFGLGALSSFVISALDSTDATAMVAVMAGCGTLALVSAIPLCLTPTRIAGATAHSAKEFPNGSS